MLIRSPITTTDRLRDSITNAYRMDENSCLEALLPIASFSEENLVTISEIARKLVTVSREQPQKAGIDTLLHQYDLSTDEGIALMCLAEALLRIPDNSTIDKFISDKISTVSWENHIKTDNSLFVNAATWSLLITGKIYAPTLNNQQNLLSSLKRGTSRLGVAMIRPFILQMMKAIGNQFVIGQTIESALKRATEFEKQGYRLSYDMLGEAARTAKDADAYYSSYEHAIDAIGNSVKSGTLDLNPAISIKLSALHPRYEYAQRERVFKELTPRLLSLAEQSRKYNIGITVDAEEADRLDLSLDIFKTVYEHPSLSGWEGLGLAIQAYQKRAPFVIDWLLDLAQRHGRRIMTRLVKGAYWDAEIKTSQILGLKGYPVFTRKNSTDVSYIACAKKLLSHPDAFYSQFGTHNAYSVAAIMQIASELSLPKERETFEFECLFGMGRALYDQVVDKKQFNLPCRIYAPVGSHKDLLGYLVRRLLENGANSSFINRLADKKIPLEKIIYDPVERIAALTQKAHPKIPLPKAIYGQWQNSQGIDLSNTRELLALKNKMDEVVQEKWQAGSIVNGKIYIEKSAHSVASPSALEDTIGNVSQATDELIEKALQTAKVATKSWSDVSVADRANMLEKAADLFEAEMPTLITMIAREGGRCILDCISEVREAVDFCRYYAYRARQDLTTITLPGPTGELNQLSLHPRGVIACISPWNFPIAIFTGQIVAALVTGNAVIAKPAEQTPLIAFKVIQLLHQAGIPTNALQLLIGKGSEVGAKLVSDPRIAGVIFTGSTETAKHIQKSLANRNGPIAVFVAETGGQNAMIVDSSVLPEQTVMDIVQSAFNSAGQRCSALRVLFVQNEIASKLIEMLKGYMAEMIVGDPTLLTTDVGPVIDGDALQMLQNHKTKMLREGTLLAQVALEKTPKGYYFAPCAFEIPNLNLLKGEVFGPILHVIRYSAHELEKVIDAIINTGYGLTFGVQSRIGSAVQYIANQLPVGNSYVNRNMIGAVVGVQPFGGEGLSGTGPKAGGPHYLPRLCVERVISINTTAVGGNAKLVSLLEEDEWQNITPLSPT